MTFTCLRVRRLKPIGRTLPILQIKRYNLSSPNLSGWESFFLKSFLCFFCSFFNAAFLYNSKLLTDRENCGQACCQGRNAASNPTRTVMLFVVRRLLGMYGESEILSTFCSPAPTSSSFVSPYGPELSPNHFLI